MLDLEDLEYVQGTLKLLGSKGTTGTQASFLELFDGDNETIDKIDPMIAKKMGFKDCYPVSGQTYSRKVDTRVVTVSYTHLDVYKRQDMAHYIVTHKLLTLLCHIIIDVIHMCL